MSEPKRKIVVFTGSRAEYGLQYPFLRALAADSRFDYWIIAGASHLQEEYGKTIAEIQANGLNIYPEFVDITLEQDNLAATAKAIGTGIIGLSKILVDIKPDFAIVYGDRYESFSAMIAITQMGIPTAHMEGGDYTEGGALDDSVRHAMTKLAHLHFTTNHDSTDRVLGLGEEPWRVFNVGYLDFVEVGDYATPDEIAKEFGLDLNRPVVLFSQHSITTELDKAVEQVKPSFEALRILAREGYQIIITYPNSDAGGLRIIAEIDALIAEGIPNMCAVKSLGRHRFHGFLNLFGKAGRGAFVGNSSAGIKETPIFNCPTVNIGARQQGRLRGENVLEVPYDATAIAAAIRRCAEDKAFRAQCANAVNPYGTGNAPKRVLEVLASLPIDSKLLQKRMTY